MSTKKPKTLYHYCSLDTFLNIIRSSSIWLSDIKKSNDSRELSWFRQQYYYYILKKYNETANKEVKSVCEIILSIAPKDNFPDCPAWLLPVSGTTAQQAIDLFNSLRVYAFCLTELSDSLGQWRGYANDGKGVAIGFSRKYFASLAGYGLLCPIFNFMLGSVSYEDNFNNLFDKIFDMCDISKTSEFVVKNMTSITHAAAMYKHPSFKEEKEWRIIYAMDDHFTSNKILNFDKFDSVATDTYKKHFDTPTIEYAVKDDRIVPHIEIGIKNLSNAINSITLGPKCNTTEGDIRHILVRFGLSDRIEIIHSDSSYQ